jgi:hypothetical protein
MTRGFYSKSTNSLCSFIMLFIAKETVRIDSGVFFRAFLLPYVLHRAEPRILLGYRLPAAGRAHTNDAAFFAARMAQSKQVWCGTTWDGTVSGNEGVCTGSDKTAECERHKERFVILCGRGVTKILEKGTASFPNDP